VANTTLEFHVDPSETHAPPNEENCTPPCYKQSASRPCNIAKVSRLEPNGVWFQMPSPGQSNLLRHPILSWAPVRTTAHLTIAAIRMGHPKRISEFSRYPLSHIEIHNQNLIKSELTNTIQMWLEHK
jgi:hypothetical protein